MFRKTETDTCPDIKGVELTKVGSQQCNAVSVLVAEIDVIDNKVTML